MEGSPDGGTVPGGGGQFWSQMEGPWRHQAERAQPQNHKDAALRTARRRPPRGLSAVVGVVMRGIAGPCGGQETMDLEVRGGLGQSLGSPGGSLGQSSGESI